MKRKTLRSAVKQVNIELLERKHKKGYEQHPVAKGEFIVWELEQDDFYQRSKGNPSLATKR